MNWHYSISGKVFGPVGDNELDALARAGTLPPDSLVWRQGLAGWISYRQARGPLLGNFAPEKTETAPPVLAQSACVECGVVSPVETMVALGGGWMCAHCKPRYLQRLLQGTAVPVERTPFAGFWIRAAAKLLDAMFLGVLFFALTFLAGLVVAIVVGAYKFAPDVAPENFILVVVLIYGVMGGVMLLYATLSKSATPGKRICGLRIVTREGTPIGFGRALGRFTVESLCCFIFWAVCITLISMVAPRHDLETAKFLGMLSVLIGLPLSLIVYLVAAFHPERRALHDLICGTRVVVK